MDLPALLLTLTIFSAPEGGTAQPSSWPPPEICARKAHWVDDSPNETAQEFEEAFGAFDERFRAFATRLAQDFDAESPLPDPATTARLRADMAEVYRALANLLPLRDAGNEAWPMKFLIEEIPGGVTLPGLTPPDRGEILRAAFLRSLVSVPMPSKAGSLAPDRSRVRFLARLDMTRALLSADAPSQNDIDALRLLAKDALTQSYDFDFHRPALIVLGDRWHISLASRLRAEVARMCEDAAK